MKVKCINVGGYNQITQDKIYEVTRESELRYKIINDSSNESTYQKSYFEIVKEDNNMNTLIKDMEEQIQDMKNKMKEMTKTLEEAKQEEAKKLERKVWTPNKGETYYYITHLNNVDYDCNSGSEFDEKVIKTHNVFKTIKEAERKAFKRQLMGDLEAFAQENNEEDIDWNNNESYKYFITYSEITKALKINSVTYTHHMGQAYFTSKKIANEALVIYKTDLLRYFESKE